MCATWTFLFCFWSDFFQFTKSASKRWAQPSTFHGSACVISSRNFHIHALCHIYPHLTLDAAKSITGVHIVDARLGCCNSLPCGVSQCSVFTHHVHNLLTRVLTQVSHLSSAIGLQWQLYWLPIHQCVDFKLYVVMLRIVHTGVPSYLMCEIHHHQTSRVYHSGSTTTLHQPYASLGFYQLFFVVLALAV